MDDRNIRERAARTAVDGFIVVERIYRHAHQILMELKDKLKTDLNLTIESPVYSNSSSSSDPSSWIHKFRGLYLAESKLSLEDYKRKEAPILFLQASLHNSKVKEPLLRYGIVEKIFNMSTWKGIRFDDYFRMILAELHANPGSNPVKASHCEARVQCVEKPLLDVREDSDVVDLAQQISEQYGELMLK